MTGTSRPDWVGSWQCRKNGGGRGNCVGEKLVETQCVIWYNMRSANGNAVCSPLMAAAAAKQRTAHVTPQPKPALPVSLPLCGRQARMGLLLWYNNRRAVIIPILWPGRYAGAARSRHDGRLYHAASRTWYNMRSANGNAVCSRLMAAAAAKQRTAHVTPQPKPALPVSLPLCGRQARMGLLLWYNNRRAVIIRGLCPTARRLRGNRLLMGNDTMPLRGHGIICAE